ncbi:MAG: J domain-containing protein [Cyanobacteria bacterium REEB417]|nr:J domain-containing protein [Cyanobacteria bacterium REEB417]
MQTTTAGVKARIAKPKGMKRDPQAAAKLAALQQGRRGRQPNARAQQAKAMANRTGVVKGKLRTDGQDVRTLSLAEMRRAVRQTLRKGGIETRKQFEKAYGKPPTTRGGWEKLYRENVALQQSERNRKARPGVINGVDIHKNYRPWQVFGLNPKTATRADVEAAFRRVAKQVHPDAGGRRRDFERVKKLRDSVLAQMPGDKGSNPAKGGKRGKASTAAPAAPRGPKLLPPGRDAAPAKPARKPRRRKPTT